MTKKKLIELKKMFDAIDYNDEKADKKLVSFACYILYLTFRKRSRDDKEELLEELSDTIGI